MGRTLENWLAEKSIWIGENERPMTCGEIKRLRLLLLI